jgi:hypothetical protein
MEEKSKEAKTLLGFLQKAEDPETGGKLMYNDLIINANTFLYSTHLCNAD